MIMIIDSWHDRINMYVVYSIYVYCFSSSLSSLTFSILLFFSESNTFSHTFCFGQRIHKQRRTNEEHNPKRKQRKRWVNWDFQLYSYLSFSYMFRSRVDKKNSLFFFSFYRLSFQIPCDISSFFSRVFELSLYFLYHWLILFLVMFDPSKCGMKIVPMLFKFQAFLNKLLVLFCWQLSVFRIFFLFSSTILFETFGLSCIVT